VKAKDSNMEPDVAALPTSDERTFALLAHILQLFTGFIGPLVIYIIKRDSRFVAFHALQALLWQAIYFVVSMLCMVMWFVLIFSTIATHSNAGSSKAPPTEFFIFFPLIWLFFMCGWIVTMILGIVYGIKANQGQWAAYPIIGRWALRLAPQERSTGNPS
jgi:uncharacterized Tic20 family protein